MNDTNAYTEIIEACQLPQEAAQFAAWFVDSLSGNDLKRIQRSDLVGAIRYAYSLITAPSTAPVTLLNPRYDELGWQSESTVCVVSHPDMPFLVDSVRITLANMGVAVHLQVNLVFTVERNAKGQVTSVEQPSFTENEPRQSLVWLEIDRTTDPQAIQRIKVALQTVLESLKTVVSDFPALEHTAQTLAQQLIGSSDPESDQAGRFLAWLCDNHFTFLGYEYHNRADGQASGDIRPKPLGLSRRGSLCGTQGCRDFDPTMREEQGLLTFAKAPEKSPIHRSVYPDVIALADRSQDGQIQGEHRLIGLFTARVYLRPAHEIPLVAEKLTAIEHMARFVPGSHNAKVLQQILQAYPRDELFQTPTEALAETAIEIVKLHERNTVRLFMNRDRFGFFCSVLLYIPRDLYTTEARIKIQAALAQALGADEASFSTYFSESVYARVQMIFRLTPSAPDVDSSTLERLATDILLRWEDQFQRALESELDEEHAHLLFARYGKTFSAGYREDFTPRRAVFDVQQIDRLTTDKPVDVALYQELGDPQDRFRLKLYALNEPVPLSSALPLLEDLGAWVISESPYVLRTQSQSVWIHDYQLTLPGGRDLTEIRTLFQEALLAAWSEESETDGFQRLVVLSALAWRDVMLLRALSAYIKQIGFELSLTWMADTLSQYPLVARDLVGLFYARFDTSRTYNPELESKLANHILDSLDQVSGLNEDRYIRRLLEVIEAIQRTNFFVQTAEGLLPYMSFKLAPSTITDMPKPVPYREIFVYSARVEGVHLRGGAVARGGLRWSDRGEDYRTEVLGLVKAQQVKNSVIVPVGAKGGFFPKRLPSLDRDAAHAEAVACYQWFISGLLDLTDNRIDGEITPPDQVRCHDAPDPYLVVAADKGTATFSDIANAISESRHFWLGDAFASGGSAGYDHKKMGITARGAWVSVQRHFKELGRDCQKELFSCVGIGDMSGDVFGNGLLRSKTTRLIAAFNHQHIFIDPNPDVEAAFAERDRLFTLPRSGWTDYDPSLISAGGGVFARNAKQIVVSREAADALGAEPGPCTPNALIQAILRAPVDLLWNGGIGTYVKASDESHLEVGDKANDAVRVDGNTLRCRIVGEGGNLGLTQRGRVEAALHGVRINTDFIDNAGGVDCSDREVNIKIHLNQLIRAGDMTVKQRDQLLVSMTDEVATLVLTNNAQQAEAVSLARLHAEDSPEDLIRFLHTQRDAGLLDPALEFLPSDETLKERAAHGLSFTTPELSVLLSYAKNELKHNLAQTPLQDDPWLIERALAGFPQTLIKRDAPALLTHPLITNIAATQWANWLVNTMGISFALRMRQASGRSDLDILKAFAVSAELFEFASHWAAIDAATGMDEVSKLNLKRQLHRLVRRSTRWLLRNRPLDVPVASEIARYKTAMEALLTQGLSQWPTSDQEGIAQAMHTWTQAGIAESTARALITGARFNHLISIAEVIEESGRTMADVVHLWVILNESLGLGTLAERIQQLPVSNAWEAMAREAFRDDLIGAMQRMLFCFARQPGDWTQPAQAIDDFAQTQCAPWHTVLTALKTSTDLNYPMMAVAIRELKVVEAQANSV